MKPRKYQPLFFLPADLLPPGFRYPDSYRSFAAAGNPMIGPVNEDWLVIDQVDAVNFMGYARKIIPHHRVVPFMRRNGEDGVVSFDGEPHDDEPRIWFFNYAVEVGYQSSNLTFSEWLYGIPREDDEDQSSSAQPAP